MASTKDLKKRILTVKNTQQTTRAMKMVSAAKLRKAHEAILMQRPYAHRLADLVQKIFDQGKEHLVSPYVFSSVDQQKEFNGGSGHSTLLVLLTSDRGLCGGFNSNVIKACERYRSHFPQESIQLIFLGKKGYDFYKHRPVLQQKYYSELGGKVTFVKAKQLATDLMKLYLSREVSAVKFIYNKFKNAVTQEVVIEDFLPLLQSLILETGAHSDPVLMKPSASILFSVLLEKYFSVQTFRIMLESQASEHGARMSAMENATQNAGEMIQQLALQYNKQRQAGITKELLEIIAGSESQK